MSAARVFEALSDDSPYTYPLSDTVIKAVSNVTVEELSDYLRRMLGEHPEDRGTATATAILHIARMWTRHPYTAIAWEFSAVRDRTDDDLTDKRAGDLWRATSTEVQSYVMFLTRFLTLSPTTVYDAYARVVVAMTENGYHIVPRVTSALHGEVDRPLAIRQAMGVSLAISAAVRKLSGVEEEVHDAMEMVRLFTVGAVPCVELIHAAIPEYLRPLTEAAIPWDDYRKFRSATFSGRSPHVAVREVFDFLSPVKSTYGEVV